EAMTNGGPSFERIDRQVEGVGTAANVGGALLTFLYFMIIDPPPANQSATAEVPPLMWGIFAGIMVLTLVAGTILCNRMKRVLREWYQRLQAGADPATLPPEVARLALTYVLRLAGISFGM